VTISQETARDEVVVKIAIREWLEVDVGENGVARVEDFVVL